MKTELAIGLAVFTAAAGVLVGVVLKRGSAIEPDPMIAKLVADQDALKKQLDAVVPLITVDDKAIDQIDTSIKLFDFKPNWFCNDFDCFRLSKECVADSGRHAKPGPCSPRLVAFCAPANSGLTCFRDMDMCVLMTTTAQSERCAGVM